MIKRYDSLIEFIQEIHNLKDTLVCVSDGFIKEVNMLPTEQFHTLKEIMKKNNIKVMEMKSNAKSRFKVK